MSFLSHVGRYLANLGLLILLTILVVVVFSVIEGVQGDDINFGNAAFFWAILFGSFLPGAAVYLVLVAFIPSDWSCVRRRVVTIALSPIAGSYLWIAEGFRVSLAEVATTLAICAVYALIVRLRPRRPRTDAPAAGGRG